MISETSTKTINMHYTKSELKIVKDMSLDDQEVATRINRSKQAVYCKRWSMRLYGKKKKDHKVLFAPTVADPISESVQVVKTKQFKKLVVGNVTIDLENRAITVNI